jgi:hypothetical protein
MYIDMINSADGIEINDCFKRRKTTDVDGININIISIDDLIKNKRTSGRLNDLSDADKLETKKGY